MLDEDAILEKAAQMKSQGMPFVMATVVRCESPTSAKPGAKAIVLPDGDIQGWIGGGCAQPAVIKMSKLALEDGQSRLIRISPNKDAPEEEGVIDFGMTCHSGGTLDIFIDPVVSQPVMMIIGASPAAQALSGLASRAGFSVTAVFPEANEAMFPDAKTIISSLDVSKLKVTGALYIVVATQGKRDEEGLEAALQTGASYIAFIASDKKAAKLKAYLYERGNDAEAIEKIISPAGVEIGAVTPEEIALSVLAGVIKDRRAGVDATLSLNDTAAGSCCGKPVESEALVNSVDPICGMQVQIDSAEYKTEYKGVMYYFCCGGCLHKFESAPETYSVETA